MNRQIQMRLGWVKLYQERGDAGFVCRRCGVSRPTLRKWVRRHEKHGIDGLHDQSKRPKRSPNRKVFEEQNGLILDLRRSHKLGPRRIQSVLKRLHDFSLSTATIHKVLKLNDVKPLRRVRRKKDYIRYQRPIPGDRVQMDTIRIAPGLYQYTAIDDCTKYKVLGFL
jgi:transposase